MTDLFGNIDEEGMYQMAISVPLPQKIEKALLLISSMEAQALALHEDGFYVCFSGGKDSIVMEDLFRLSGVCYSRHYSNVTIDPPELVQFIKRQYPGTIWHNPERHLCSEIVNHATGLPLRNSRWCCEIYKEQGGNGTIKAMGVRAEESKRRKGLWQTIKVDSRTRLPVVAPILYWTDADVWEYIRSNNLKYPSLYDAPFSAKRLGCVGCPLSNNRNKEFAYWPKYEAMWKKGGRAWWEKYSVKLKADGSSYFAAKFPTFEAYWSWWMQEKNVNNTDEPDCQMWLW